jgi:phage gp29-like protein
MSKRHKNTVNFSDEVNKPLASAALPRSQKNYVATARNDITIPYYNGILHPQDIVLLERGHGKGLAIYDELERDTSINAVLQKRKMALVAREWAVTPATEDPRDNEAAEFVTEVLKGLNFDRMCLELMDATLKGFAVSEIIWHIDEGKIVPLEIKSHDPRRFCFDENWDVRLKTFTKYIEGEDLPERKFIVHRFGVKGNDPYGLGLGSKLFFPYLFKRQGVSFWLKYLEKFASPTPIGKYPLGMLSSEQDRLLDSLRSIALDSAVVVPMGTEVTFLQTGNSANTAYEDFAEYWDQQMAICVFGSSLATSIKGGGSRAAASIHKDVEEQIVDADSDLLSETLSRQLIQWLMDYNYPGVKPPKVIRIRSKNEREHEELELLKSKRQRADLDNLFTIAPRIPVGQEAVVLSTLMGAGLLPQLDENQIKALIPTLISSTLPLGANVDPGSTASTGKGDATSFADDDEDKTGFLSSDLEDATTPVTSLWLKKIKAKLESVIATGGSHADFSEQLLEVYDELDIDAMGNIIGAGLTLAELTGRSDVSDEMRGKRK